MPRDFAPERLARARSRLGSRCSRCREPGHQAPRCQNEPKSDEGRLCLDCGERPAIRKQLSCPRCRRGRPPLAELKTRFPSRCSRCGETGHNRTGCAATVPVLEHGPRWCSRCESAGAMHGRLHCGSCVAALRNERAEEDAEYATARAAQSLKSHLKKRGLTPGEFERRLLEQGGVCAICRQPETAVRRSSGKILRLAVDHDHETGEIRGLLCARCNTAIGLLDESHERLLAAGDYLRRAASTRIGQPVGDQVATPPEP